MKTINTRSMIWCMEQVRLVPVWPKNFDKARVNSRMYQKGPS